MDVQSAGDQGSNIVEGQFDDADMVTQLSDPIQNISMRKVSDEEPSSDSESDEENAYEEGGDWIDPDEANKGHWTGSHGPNQQKISEKLSHYQPAGTLFSKYLHQIKVEKYEGPILEGLAGNYLASENKKMEANRYRVRDKEQRATVEQVMDPRTRMIVFKLLNQGVIMSINGCISTGKEANVYHATSKNGDLAIKIYKTSILVFKDRDKYVTGEFRFRHGYCRHNPRKLVRTWAEKEMRN